MHLGAAMVDDDIGGLPVCAGLATDEHLARARSTARRAEARVLARRLVREHGLPMKVVGVDYLDEAEQLHHLLQRPAPGRLPRARPGPGRPLGPRRAAPDRPAGRGPAAGRHRPVRARPVLRDVPQGLRAGVGPDGQGPGPAGEPAADRRRCGRLMCCLKYEHPLYQDFRPRRRRSAQVESPEGAGMVVGTTCRLIRWW